MNYLGQVFPSFVVKYSYHHRIGITFSVTVIQTIPITVAAGMYLDSLMLYILSKVCSGHNDAWPFHLNSVKENGFETTACKWETHTWLSTPSQTAWALRRPPNSEYSSAGHARKKTSPLFWLAIKVTLSGAAKFQWQVRKRRRIKWHKC